MLQSTYTQPIKYRHFRNNQKTAKAQLERKEVSSAKIINAESLRSEKSQTFKAIVLSKLAPSNRIRFLRLLYASAVSIRSNLV